MIPQWGRKLKRNSIVFIEGKKELLYDTYIIPTILLSILETDLKFEYHFFNFNVYNFLASLRNQTKHTSNEAGIHTNNWTDDS